MPCRSLPEDRESHGRAADVVPVQRGVDGVGAFQRHAVLHGVAAIAAVHHLDCIGGHPVNVQAQLVATAAPLVTKRVARLRGKECRV